MDDIFKVLREMRETEVEIDLTDSGRENCLDGGSEVGIPNIFVRGEYVGIK